MNIATEFQKVLQLQPAYSQTVNDQMIDRQKILDSAAETIRSWLASIDTSALGLKMDLQVKVGGRQANFAPVPWIRIYSKSHAPSAQKGFYLVYLFSADGSRYFLSLNQGTSEFRANQWRPISDTATIRTSALNARKKLSSQLGGLLNLTVQDIDLGIDTAAVSS